MITDAYVILIKIQDRNDIVTHQSKSIRARPTLYKAIKYQESFSLSLV